MKAADYFVDLRSFIVKTVGDFTFCNCFLKSWPNSRRLGKNKTEKLENQTQVMTL